ncbi:MAG: TIGR03905 family TSCPD domain-containing protein [Pseudobutyrivibrio sp.]|nr:TIGR03905 family TSCPD domain-containing protein [Pseudobutyrivibrio sp.]
MIRKDFKNTGTCSRGSHIEIDENGIITAAEIFGGCNGNTKGVCKLVVGRDAKEIADLLRGTKCGMRSTSCPDQLALAIDEALAQA